MLENMTVPKHVAVILDGNGRWAKKHGVPRAMGHKAGCETLEKMVRIAADMGIFLFYCLRVFHRKLETFLRKRSGR